MSAGTDLRDQGVDAVLAADQSILRGYGDLARDSIEHYAAAGVPFSAEDVRDHVAREHPDAEPHSPNVLPACFSGARASGLIRAIGFRPATRPSRHGSVIRTWIGAA